MFDALSANLQTDDMHSPGEEEQPNHSGVRNSLKADLLNAAATTGDVASLWSTFVPSGASPADTLKSMHAPAFTVPDIEPRRIAYRGDDSESADYVIFGKLGEGGMGIVFKAEQRHLRQRVALKMIKADRANDPLARNSFFYEAVTTAGLEHPGIIPVLEFGITQDGREFYVMKKASGVPWHRVIREKSRAENLEIFNRVTDTVGYAHGRGVIHRDLKPANILLGEHGEVWVGDWGVALRCNVAGNYTHAHPGGTPAYMAPEMARCDSTRIGPRSDVYLLGAVLYEIVTGTPPHAGDEPFAALGNATSNILKSTTRVDGLLRVAYKAMAAAPEQRYGDVEMLQRAVRECLAEDESAALVRRADAQFTAALKTGGYDAFQQALADYDAALAVSSGNRGAIRGRKKALLAYARRALANGEYDLALSIIGQELSSSTEITALAGLINREKRATQRRRTRHGVITVAAIVMAIAVVLAVILFYHANSDKLEDISAAARTYDTAMRTNQENRVYNGIVLEVRMIGTALVVMSQGNIAVRRDRTVRDIINRMATDFVDLEENFRFPDLNDTRRKNAACAAVVNELPRIRADRNAIKDLAERTEYSGDAESLSSLVTRLDRLIEYLEAFKPSAEQ